MSSLIKSLTGLRRIEVIVRGHRKRIRLGRMPDKLATSLQVRIDALAEAVALGGRDAEAEKWCDRLGPSLRKRLIDAGILPAKSDETLQGLVDRVKKARSHVKASTKAADQQAYGSLIDWFTGAKLIRSINEVGAQEWRDSLVAEKLATATISKRVIKGRALFSQAVKWKLIDGNPMAELRTGSQKNSARQQHIDDEQAQSLLAACSNAEWRGIFAMARWGGVRIPSEIRSMTWVDVLWDKRKLRVVSPKTEHHEGGAERWIPLWPELETALRELFELAEPGEVKVFKRRSAGNYRKNMLAIIRRAGLTPWPRLFQNLRASRETELCGRGHPLDQVCRWLGNSAIVAYKHYLTMREGDFENAAQKEAQQGGARGRNANSDEINSANISAKNRNSNEPRGRAMLALVGGEGLDDARTSLGKSHRKQAGGAKSGAPGDGRRKILRAMRRSERALTAGLAGATRELRTFRRRAVARLSKRIRKARG